MLSRFGLVGGESSIDFGVSNSIVEVCSFSSTGFGVFSWFIVIVLSSMASGVSLKTVVLMVLSIVEVCIISSTGFGVLCWFIVMVLSSMPSGVSLKTLVLMVFSSMTFEVSWESLVTSSIGF